MATGYKRIVTFNLTITIKEKAQRVLELHTWLKESKETDEAKVVWYAAGQAKKKYQILFIEAYQYCIDSAKCFDDELRAYMDLVDVAKRLKLI